MKPKIGITSKYDNSQGVNTISPYYAKAVEEAGGLPLILPYTRDPSLIEEYADNLDGILFSGGSNICPTHYGDKIQSNCGYIEYERDLFELYLCKTAAEKNKPLLGICRGCQLITVAYGGTLIQHKEGHDQTEDKHVTKHTVNIAENTLLYSILNTDRTEVNSFHHQTVKNTGDLSSAAFSDDGSVEAVYMPGKKFILGVQWHPERMYQFNIHAKLIFDSFISCCC